MVSKTEGSATTDGVTVVAEKVIINGATEIHVNGEVKVKDAGGKGEDSWPETECGESDSDSQDTDPPSEQPAEKDKEPMQQICDVKEFEARYDHSGKRELKAVGVVEDKKEVDSDDEKAKYALCSYKYYSKTGEVEDESVEIMSAHIIKALQEVIGEYPDEHFWSPTVTIEAPYKCVFHHRDDLAAHAKKADTKEASGHIELLLSYVEKELRRPIAQYTANVVNASETPSISYTNLWMVYRPGQLFYTGSVGGSMRCMEIVDSWYTQGNCAAWVVQGKTFTHDGTGFGYETHTIRQSPYKGMKALAKVAAVHEKYLEDESKLRAGLIRRGQVFVDHAGSHYRAYNGLAMALSNVRDWNMYGEYKEEPTVVKSRIMVDAKMFGIEKSPNRIRLDENKVMPKDVSAEELREYITERDLLTADCRVPGYALETKRWCWFSLDKIAAIKFNTEAFNSLLIPARQKSLVHGLVRTHVSGTDEFDDLISGKGKGLCFVLWGPPGIGKTFTAESVADHIQQPLYILNSGELGIEPKEVETNLNRALMLAMSWNAILLIDEADVFLEQRSVQDLQRNCLVSIFLRTLEYYEGILFLTTNRITTFDPAFRSRVHLALRYHPLTSESRKELWRTFIARTGKDAPKFSDRVLESLAQVDVNGRQIKNAVRTASALARSEKTRLNEQHLMGVLETIAEFERDFHDNSVDEFGMPLKADT